MKTTNLDVRIAVIDNRVSFKAVAAQMGVTPEYLSRVMGKQLNPLMRARILAALAELTGQEVGRDVKAK